MSEAEAANELLGRSSVKTAFMDSIVHKLGLNARDNLLEQIDELCLILDFMVPKLQQISNQLKSFKGKQK